MTTSDHIKQIHSLNYQFSAKEKQFTEEISALLHREKILKIELKTILQKCEQEKIELKHAVSVELTEQHKAAAQEIRRSYAYELETLKLRESELLSQIAHNRKIEQEAKNHYSTTIEFLESQAAALTKCNDNLKQQIQKANDEQLNLKHEHQAQLRAISQNHEKYVQELKNKANEKLTIADIHQQDLAAQLLKQQQQTLHIKEQHLKAVRDFDYVMARNLAKYKQDLKHQNNSSKKKTYKLLVSWKEKENNLSKQLDSLIKNFQEEKEALLRDRAKREQAFAEQIILLQEKHLKYSKEHAEDYCKKNEQMEIYRLEKGWAKHEAALNSKIISLENEIQSLKLSQKLELQQLDFIFEREQLFLREKHSALEERLKAQLEAEQALSERFENIGINLKQALEESQQSFCFRLQKNLKNLLPKNFSSFNLPVHGDDKNLRFLTEKATFNESSEQVDQYAPIEGFTMPSISTMGNTPTTAATLDELLSCNGIHFIRSAYKTLLGRDADQQGLNYYNNRFITGYTKIGLLMQIYTSAESRSRAHNIEGLDTAIGKYKLGKLPAVGFLFRAFNPSISDSDSCRSIRAIERQLFDLKMECKYRFDGLEDILKDISSIYAVQADFVKSDAQDHNQSNKTLCSNNLIKSTSQQQSPEKHISNILLKNQEKTPLENFSR